MTDTRISPETLVNREVLACCSSLVAALAGGFGQMTTHVDAAGRRSTNGGDLADLTEQAFELAAPVDDWEEAAIQAGWAINTVAPFKWVHPMSTAMYVQSPRACTNICEDHSIDPYQWEVFEHWIVSDWLADKLIEQGERVDKDFAGLCIWARTTTGQAIAADAVMVRICNALNAEA